MAVVDSLVSVVHLGFAGLWTGSVLFLTIGVLPSARDGSVDPEVLGAITERFRWVSRLSALALFLTGGHMAGTRYTVESLTGTPRGHLVLTMLALWFALAALVEVGSARIADGVAERKVRTPAAAARPFLYAASVVAALLLVDAGLLAGGLP